MYIYDRFLFQTVQVRADYLLSGDVVLVGGRSDREVRQRFEEISVLAQRMRVHRRDYDPRRIADNPNNGYIVPVKQATRHFDSYRQGKWKLFNTNLRIQYLRSLIVLALTEREARDGIGEEIGTGLLGQE